LVGVGEIDPLSIIAPDPAKMNPDVQAMMIAHQYVTEPYFPWSKMMFYVLQGILDKGKLKRAAREIAKGVTRPRATGSVTIPGNANIELLDTFNGAWAIVSITHNGDLQSKNWTTSLSLELIMGAVPDDNEGSGAGPIPGQEGGAAGSGSPTSPGLSSTISTLGGAYNSEVGIDLEP
jgi:hypothetical protein